MSDKDIYFGLKNITSLICSLYEKLSYLEINNKKDTKEYFKILCYIERIKKIENIYCDMFIKDKGEDYFLDIAIMSREDMKNKIPVGIVDYRSILLTNEINSDDLLCMRIFNKMIDLFCKERKKDGSEEYFDSLLPMKDKFFLEILDDLINDKDSSGVRNILIKAKYQYAFVNFKEVDMNIALNLSTMEYNYLKILEEFNTYIKKYSKLNKYTLNSKYNRRKLLLESNYIRALLLELNDETLEFIRKSIEKTKNEVTCQDGLNVLLNILDFASSDKEKYLEEGMTFKRKY